MRLVIDMDGTICTEEKTFSRSMAKINAGAKEFINYIKNMLRLNDVDFYLLKQSFCNLNVDVINT